MRNIYLNNDDFDANCNKVKKLNGEYLKDQQNKLQKTLDNTRG